MGNYDNLEIKAVSNRKKNLTGEILEINTENFVGRAKVTNDNTIVEKENGEITRNERVLDIEYLDK